MACGSVYAKESQQLGRDLNNLDLTGGTDRTPRASPSLKTRALHQDSPGNRKEFNFSHRSGHEAVKFLQAEHEKVLTGLHQQMQELQKKCDDLQFEAHLRHVISDGESTWKDRVADLTQNLEQRESVIAELQREIDHGQRQAEELTQQSRWREVQLQQQIETGEQKIVELKEECYVLRAKVRDLRIYSAALRRGDQGDSAGSIRPGSSNSYIPDDLNDEPLSLESEESFSGGWREARYSNSQARRTRKTSGTSVDKPLPNQQYLSLSGSFDLSGGESPAKLKRGTGGPRPGSVVLPPINLSQSVGRPQFRQHMRFSSAPPTETKSLGTRRRPSDTGVSRRKYAE